MVLKHRQKLWQRVALSWFTILGLLLMTVLLTRGVWGIYLKNQESTKRADTAKVELSKLVERKKAISDNLEHIKSSAGVEAELRSKFDVARDGEHLLVIIDQEIQILEHEVKKTWWDKLWHKVIE